MVMSVQHCKYTKIQRIVYCKWVNFIVGELYHNKGVKKEPQEYVPAEIT